MRVEFTADSWSEDEEIDRERDIITGASGSNDEDINVLPSSLTTTLLEIEQPISMNLGPYLRLPQPSIDKVQDDEVPIILEATTAAEESTAGIITSLRPDQSLRDDQSVCHRVTELTRDEQCCNSDSHTVLSPTQNTTYPAMPEFAPGSISSTSHSVDTPTARWLELLIGDAALDNGTFPDIDLECSALSMFGNSIAQTPTSAAVEDRRTPVFRTEVSLRSVTSRTLHASLQERLPQLGSDQVSEKHAWYSIEPIKLSPQECRLFHHFVQHISQWIDLFEPKKPFGTFVPHLAMHNFGLMNAILALAARHVSLSTEDSHAKPDVNSPDANDAVRYYYRTLHYSQEAMKYDTYKVSLELLAISIIISTYEMLDGSSTDWERHLKGVFWIQRSQVIHGDSGGLRQGVWWAWLCQDIWAAFREERKPFTFWWPTRSFDALDPCELAARSVYLFAQVVSCCSREETEEDRNDFASRVFKADALVEKWNVWREHLTVEFEALPVAMDPKDVFPPIWVHPPAFGVMSSQCVFIGKSVLQVARMF
ncbi:hypothetical protein G7Z17_g4566 [Cylindrodendrum hubeiense]|uniref:Transcription factor domain-containing protein n=1 Tax=Cylindrodendrum hubeiense TaxID=595255 RepID=A0A9P5LH08_9HYPO|nr:hypothetical protein G7Z17_g4566 [Cylindrodendrum hubeiense]